MLKKKQMKFSFNKNVIQINKKIKKNIIKYFF